jgi:hypothetical protein
MLSKSHAALRLAALAAAISLGLAVTAPAFAQQPEMEAALQSLMSAKSSLEHAAHDKGGNREKALNAVNNAIAFTEAGIKVGATHQ